MREKVVITGEAVEVKLINNTGFAVSGTNLAVLKMAADRDDCSPNHTHEELSAEQREEVEILLSRLFGQVLDGIRSSLWDEEDEDYEEDEEDCMED